MIVVAGNSAATQPFDLSWLLRYLPDHCLAVIESSDLIDGSRPWVVQNLAHEALPYLRFIIDHYDCLPARTAFLHGHRASWHSKDMAVVLRSLSWGLDYANLNFNSGLHLAPDAPVEGGGPLRYANIQAVWPTVFEPWFGPIPPYFNVHCCGQFMVSRDAIRALPLAFWQAYFSLALQSPFEEPADLAILYEHMWGYVMTRGTWNATILGNADAELCTVLETCPLPLAPIMEPAVWRQEQRGFYPCGAFPQGSSTNRTPGAGGHEPSSAPAAQREQRAQRGSEQLHSNRHERRRHPEAAPVQSGEPTGSDPRSHSAAETSRASRPRHRVRQSRHTDKPHARLR